MDYSSLGGLPAQALVVVVVIVFVGYLWRKDVRDEKLTSETVSQLKENSAMLGRSNEILNRAMTKFKSGDLKA